MLCQCLITGARWRMPNLPDFEGTLDYIHPVLMLDSKQLSGITIPSKEQDANLYFYSWLYKGIELGKVKFTNMPAPRFSVQWIQQTTIKLAQVIRWITTNSQSTIISEIPSFRLTCETSQADIQEWLNVCLDTIRQYQSANALRNSEANKVLNSLGYGAKSEPDYSASQDELIRRPLQTNGRYLVKWIYESFAHLTEMSELQYRILYGTIMRPGRAQLPALKRAKLAVLDNGLERTIEQFNQKLEVVSALDKAIVNREGVATILSQYNQSDTASNPHKDKTVGVGTTNAYTVLDKKLPPDPNKPIREEPKESEFPNRLAYLAAHRRWKMQQRKTQ